MMSTGDIGMPLEHIFKNYAPDSEKRQVFIMGASLGGGICLNYLGLESKKVKGRSLLLSLFNPQLSNGLVLNITGNNSLDSTWVSSQNFTKLNLENTETITGPIILKNMELILIMPGLTLRHILMQMTEVHLKFLDIKMHSTIIIKPQLCIGCQRLRFPQ